MRTYSTYICTYVRTYICTYCKYRMRVNFRGTKLSRIADFQIFADAGVTNIILLVCTSISILIKIMKLSGFFAVSVEISEPSPILFLS